MNWTGGRLQRQTRQSTHATLIQKQKEHFAKVRTKLQSPQNVASPFKPSFWQEDFIGICEAREHESQELSRQNGLEEAETVVALSRQQSPLRDLQSHYGSSLTQSDLGSLGQRGQRAVRARFNRYRAGKNSEHVASNNPNDPLAIKKRIHQAKHKPQDELFEDKRKTLLVQRDWLGIQGQVQSTTAKAIRANKRKLSPTGYVHRQAHGRKRVKSPIFQKQYVMTNAIAAGDESIEIKIGDAACVSQFSGARSEPPTRLASSHSNSTDLTQIHERDSQVAFKNVGGSSFNKIAMGESFKESAKTLSSSDNFTRIEQSRKINSFLEHQEKQGDKQHTHWSNSSTCGADEEGKAQSSRPSSWLRTQKGDHDELFDVVVCSTHSALQPSNEMARQRSTSGSLNGGLQSREVAARTNGIQTDVTNQDRIWQGFLRTAECNTRKEPDEIRNHGEMPRRVTETNKSGDSRAPRHQEPASLHHPNQRINANKPPPTANATHMPKARLASENETNELWKSFVFGTTSPTSASEDNTFPHNIAKPSKKVNVSKTTDQEVMHQPASSLLEISEKGNSDGTMATRGQSSNSTHGSPNSESTFSLDRPSSVANASVAPSVLYNKSREPQVQSSPDPLTADQLEAPTTTIKNRLPLTRAPAAAPNQIEKQKLVFISRKPKPLIPSKVKRRAEKVIYIRTGRKARGRRRILAGMVAESDDEDEDEDGIEECL